MKSFYLVWSPQGSTPPSKRHDSEQSARDEAERLALQSNGAQFFVMEAVSVSELRRVQTVQLVKREEELPF